MKFCWVVLVARMGFVPLLLFMQLGVRVASAADMFTKGDVVEVNHKNEWHLGRVESVTPQELVTVTYNPTGKDVKSTFKGDNIRAAEKLADQTPRAWTDSTGKVQLLAELIAIGKFEVAMRKPDMTVVIIGIDKLSRTDQSLLKSALMIHDSKKRVAAIVAKQASPPNAEPAVEKKVDLAGNLEVLTFQPVGTSTTVSGISLEPTLVPDPLPPSLKMPEGGMSFEVESVYERVQRLIPLGGGEKYLLAATGDVRSSSGKPVRLVWCALGSKKITGQQLLPPDELVVDYDPISHRLLTITNRQVNDELLTKNATILSVWEVLPSAKVVTAIARWKVDQQFMSFDQEWARFASGNLVLHRNKNDRLTAWDIDQKGARYVLSLSEKPPQFSPGRKYLLVPQNNSLNVFDPSNGEALASFPAMDIKAFGLSDDGKRLAIADSQRMSVWDFTNPTQVLKEYHQPPLASHTNARLGFLGDRIAVLAPGRVSLYSTARDLPLWDYGLTLEQFNDHRLLDGRLFYATAGEGVVSKQIIVGGVKLPGPGVDAAETTLKYIEPPTYLQRGSIVKLEVDTGEFNEQVRATLEKKIAANGWKLADQADTVVRARFKLGELKTMMYTDRFRVRREQVTLRTYDRDVTIINKDKQVWSRSGGFHGLPHEIRLFNNETLAEWVARTVNVKIDASFFEQLTISETIQAPPNTRAAGISMVGPRGIVPN